MAADPPEPRRRLRRVVLLAFAPLCIVVLAASLAQYLLARAVHQDVLGLFEELREVALARTLVDELRGVEQWVESSPGARRAADAAIFADVDHHLAAARATLSRFPAADDPSRLGHDATETTLFERIAAALSSMATAAGGDVQLAALQPSLRGAVHDALALLDTIDDETRALGSELEERTAAMGQFLLLLGVSALATVAGLGWLLLRRVLRPVHLLQQAAVRLGRGELDLEPAVAQPDELGDLAAAFRTMARQLRQGREDLEQRVEQRSREVLRTARLAELGTLAAGIAHEINNPLASIVACADGLLRDLQRGGPGDQDAVREYLQILRKEALRARDITVRLLALARQQPPHRDLLWLGDELAEVQALFQHQLADAGVRLRLGIDGRGPAIHGDAAEWRQVLYNLLRNALDASPRGGTIDVELRADGADVELCVRDEGPGIAATDLDRVFEPFFTTKAPGAGTGLGLAIVHRIVTAHGGSIQATNGERGAVFTIRVAAASVAGDR